MRTSVGLNCHLYQLNAVLPYQPTKELNRTLRHPGPLLASAVTKLGQDYLDGGFPISGHRAGGMDELTDAGLLTLADPDPHGPHHDPGWPPVEPPRPTPYPAASRIPTLRREVECQAAAVSALPRREPPTPAAILAKHPTPARRGITP